MICKPLFEKSGSIFRKRGGEGHFRAKIYVEFFCILKDNFSHILKNVRNGGEGGVDFKSKYFFLQMYADLQRNCDKDGQQPFGNFLKKKTLSGLKGFPKAFN